MRLGQEKTFELTATFAKVGGTTNFCEIQTYSRSKNILLPPNTILDLNNPRNFYTRKVNPIVFGACSFSERLCSKNIKWRARIIYSFQGDRAAAIRWLETPAKALGGKQPSELISTSVGTNAVLDLIARIEHGIIT